MVVFRAVGLQAGAAGLCVEGAEGHAGAGRGGADRRELGRRKAVVRDRLANTLVFFCLSRSFPARSLNDCPREM